MTDQDVASALDRLEQLLAAPLEFPNAKAVADWHASFKLALAGAERGPQWPALKLRARLLGRQLQRRQALLQEAQRRLKRDLTSFPTSRRALSAYKSLV